MTAGALPGGWSALPAAIGWPAWTALAVLCALTLLPAPATARAAALSAGNRLAAPAGRTASRAVPWAPLAAAVCAALTAAVLHYGGPALAVAGAASAGCAAVLARDVVRGRAAEARRRDLLVAVRVLVGELAAGSQSAAALQSAALTCARAPAAFAGAADAARAGLPAAGVLLGSDDPVVRRVGLAWQLGDSTGAPTAGVLERVAADLAAADELRRTVTVALAGPRSSAALLSALPLLGLALGAAMGAHPVAFLLDPGAGRTVCCVGVLLDCAGVLWVRRILRRAQPA